MAIANPYPGLRPFEETDAHLFFGRKQAVDELLALLRDHRFLAVLGLSGSGKSSLIRAGLLPAMHLGRMGEEFADWRVATFQPGMDPLGSLAAALADPNVLGPDPDGHALLERSGRGLAERALRASLADGSYLLVFVDQFEEIFRFQKERAQGPNEAAHFVRLLLEAAREEWSRVHVLITMRSDFLGECSQFPGLPETLGHCQYLVRSLTPDQRREAIEQPARLARIALEPQLVQRVLNDAGDDPAQLPVLQHALMRTCERGAPGPLTVEHYEAAGTMRQALDRHAQAIFDGLSEPDQRITRRMFRCLAERRAGARDTRRPTTVAKIAAVSGVSEARVKDIYRHFSGEGRTFLTCRNARAASNTRATRLDSADDLTSESLVDVGHESLLHLWKPLSRWIEMEETLGRRFTSLAEGWRTHPDDILEGSSLDRAREWLEDVQADLPDGLSAAKRSEALEAWAQRYPVRRGDVETPVAFSDVQRLIERSEAERARDHAALRVQERRQRYLYQFIGVLAVAVFLAGGAYWQAHAQKQQLEELTGRLRQEKDEKTQAATLAREKETVARAAKLEADGLRLAAQKQLDAEAMAKLEATAAKARAIDALNATRRALEDTEKAHKEANQARADAEAARRSAEEALGEADRAVIEADRQRKRAVSRLVVARSETLRTQSASLLPISVAVGLAGIQYSNADPELIKQAGELWRSALTLLPRPARPPVSLPSDERLVGFGFSRNGGVLVTSSHTAKATMLRLWSEQGTPIRNTSVERSADGLTMSADGRFAAVLNGSRVVVWDTQTGSLSSARHLQTINTVAFAADGQLFATGSDDQSACLWRSANATKIRCFEHPGSEYVESVDFSPDGRRLATGTDEKWVRVWNVAGNDKPVVMGSETGAAQPSHGARVNAVRFAPDGSALASASADRTVRLWDAATGKLRNQMQHTGPVSQVAFSPDGRLLATAGADNTARVWTAAGRIVVNLAHENRIQAIAFSPDSRYVATASADKTARVWDASRGTETWRAVHDNTVFAVAFSADGGQFATASGDRTARVWEIPPVKPAIEGGAADAVFGGRELLAVLGSDRDVRVWDLARSRIAETVRGPVNRIAFSSDGRQVAVARSQRDSEEVQILPLPFDAQRAAARPIRVPSLVTAMAFDAEGKYIAIATGSTGAIWDVATQRSFPFSLRHESEINTVAFSADGSLLATGSDDGTAAVWDARTGARLATLLHPQPEWVTVVQFSPDGNQLATGTDENLAHLWDWRSGSEVRRFAHSDDVVALAFDLAGGRLATASDDNTARVWNISTGSEEKRFGLASPGRAVRFSPDNLRLSTVSLNGAVAESSLRAEDLMADACARLPRNLTPDEWATHIGSDIEYTRTCSTLR